MPPSLPLALPSHSPLSLPPPPVGQEHETALRYFQRALQLDPTGLPYAYTLAGHEYFANEDFEKGIACYRNAIRIDPRHYNAWWVGGWERARVGGRGAWIGQCLLPSAVFAALGVSAALRCAALPPRAAAPRCRFGMGLVYHRQEKYGMGEYHFRRALSINHRSSVLRCYLGMALHKLKRNPEALEYLGQVGAGGWVLVGVGV